MEGSLDNQPGNQIHPECRITLTEKLEIVNLDSKIPIQRRCTDLGIISYIPRDYELQYSEND